MHGDVYIHDCSIILNKISPGDIYLCIYLYKSEKPKSFKRRISDDTNSENINIKVTMRMAAERRIFLFLLEFQNKKYIIFRKTRYVKKEKNRFSMKK